ncbi:MAG: response regulator transcription factor [Deltaproteobacteria bacterium]|nr:response regulator transcription factor [Deltaproteobacteria bacterium]
MIRILIADDHAVVRQGLIQIVSDTSDIVVSDEASNGREVLAKISKNKYDVVVLDVAMPDFSGLDILNEIKRENPELPVLMLSIYPEEQYAVRALKAGASGYLTKKVAPKELIRAIRKVYSGGKYVTSTLAERLAFYLAEDEKPPHESLSDREFQVMLMLAEGKRVKDIAKALFISDKTVSSYKSRIFEKMRVISNAELTRYAIKHGLIE